MGWWEGSKLGLKVNSEDEVLAQQFLSAIGVDLIDCDIVEEIGELNDLSDYTVEGSVKGNLLGIMPSLEKKFSDYQKQFDCYGNDEDEEYEEDKGESDSGPDIQLDDLFLVAKKLFSRPSMYLAHEDGNNTSDTYYRYEAIYISTRKKESNCYYSYGDGVNVDTGDPKEEGTETNEEKMSSQRTNEALISSLINIAKSKGYSVLLQKLTGNPTKSAKAAIKKVPGLKVINDVVVSYSGKNTHVDIPEGITTIAECAFKENSFVQSITLPEGIKSIGKRAFEYCGSLTNIVFPQSLESIGESAFYLCTSLEKVVFPEQITSIGKYAFADCNKLTEIIIPNSIKKIEEGTFNNCYGLTHVVLPSMLSEIGKEAFKFCDQLRMIEFPSSLKRICESAFYACKGLSELSLPEGLEAIESTAFKMCDNILKLHIPDSITLLGGKLVPEGTELHISSLESWLKISADGSPLSPNVKLFINGDLLEDLIIPSGITNIKLGAFREYAYLTSVTIPDTVISVGNIAFAKCSQLKKAIVPKALEEMISNNRVFINCDELEEIQYV